MFASATSADQTLAEVSKHWWTAAATTDQRRVIKSLARYPHGLTRSNLRRFLAPMPRETVNAALHTLIPLGVIVSPSGRIAFVHPAVRAAIPVLQEVTILRHLPKILTPRPHAQLRGLRKWTRQRVRERMRKVDPSLVWSLDRLGRLVARKRMIGGKKTLPPWGTPAYGRALLSRRGGLARQRQLKAMGVDIVAVLHAARRKKALERAQKAAESL